MAHASFFSMITGVFGEKQVQASEKIVSSANSIIHNSQNVPILESSINPNVKSKKNTKNIPLVTIIGSDALLPNDTLMGVGLENVSSGKMTVYKVKKGDTLSEIAERFDISVNTIRWANNISGQKIRIGQKLDILPVTGVKHIVRRGDNLIKIARRYDAKLQDILVFNGISKKDILKQKEVLYIPNGIIKKSWSRSRSHSKSVRKSFSLKMNRIYKSNRQAPLGYFIRPVVGPVTSPYGPRRGGFHYGVDIGARRGTPAVAAASGIVTTTVKYCIEGRIRCGGGYGNYIIIQHPNGMKTRYAHLSHVLVYVGEKVKQGQLIAKTGNTGHTTGPHIHFEEENSYGSKLRPRF